MDAFSSYTYGTAAWLSAQAVPLLLTPKIILALMSSDRHQSTDIEVYLARSLSLTLLLLAAIVLFFTGAVPLSSSPVSTEDARSPYASPLITVTTLFHASSAIYCYARYTSIASAIVPIGSLRDNTAGYVLGGIGYGTMACIGVWCLMFGSGRGHLSKRTGADKRTAGFPFKNQSAYDKKKDRKMG